MFDKNKLNVVLYWHMHQPDYKVSSNDNYRQPWTYLHTIKDYVDMAMHLESAPNAKAVFNFTPVLLDQIDDYASQVANFLENKTPIRDPLLSALANSTLAENANNRIELVDWCMRAHEERIIQRYPAYKQLVDMNTLLQDKQYAHMYLSDQYLTDLVVWYHLGWLAEIVKRNDIRVKKLIKKAHSFNPSDRIELLTIIGELLSSVIPRYRAMADTGQIEITTTPYAHPIIPLLIDFDSATEAFPDIKMPKFNKYPGGEQRANWHIQASIETFEHHFHFKPAGCWPSEGSLSDNTCELLQNHGFQWTASGTNVLRNSINQFAKHEDLPVYEYNSVQIDGQNITCFFRDDELSDLIGFEYSNWHADDAVANLIHRLLGIAENKTDQTESIVAIILDGENAWEHYPKNGYYFLNALYKELSSHPEINLTTFSEHLKTHKKRQRLPRLVAGSWVYGTFTTWIGSDEKNLAWDMLCEAKVLFDNKVASGELSENEIAEATQQLAKCESSDWFWWFGDYNPAISVSSFEKLFRENLIHLYKLLHSKPPGYLYSSFTTGDLSATEDGTMRRGSDTF